MSDEKKYAVLVQEMAKQYGQSPSEFANTLMATIMPDQRATAAQVHALLLVAREHGLNPWTREIYAFPGRGGSIMPIVGLDGWLRLANRHDQFDGMDVEFVDGKTLDDKPDKGCKVSVYRKDRAHPIVHIAWYSECKRGTDPWKQMPMRMLENRATCQAIRRAFSFSGIMDPDEGQQAMEMQAAERDSRIVEVEATQPETAQERMSGLTARLNEEERWEAANTADDPAGEAEAMEPDPEEMPRVKTLAEVEAEDLPF